MDIMESPSRLILFEPPLSNKFMSVQTLSTHPLTPKTVAISVKMPNRKFRWMAGNKGWDVKLVSGNMEWHLQREKLMAESTYFRRLLAPCAEVRTW